MIYAPYRWHASSPTPQGGVLRIEEHYQENEKKPSDRPRRPRGRPRKHAQGSALK